MGFLTPAALVAAQAAAAALAPPPPPDVAEWAVRNVVFDERSPFPGPFDLGRFPFLTEILDALSPEHPCREVTLRGDAQWGKTTSVIHPALGAWFEYAPLDALVVHPTGSAAKEWVRRKWLPLRRQAPALRSMFGPDGGDKTDTLFDQESLDRTRSLKVASAGSPSDLTGSSRRLVILDDLAKYESGAMGDPESLAESRASGYEDAKILRCSTAMLKGTCRITRAFERGDQRWWHVPCPHCDVFAPLLWENFLPSIDPANPAGAHFSCESCGGVIEGRHKAAIVARGRWVAHNPAGDHPSFHLWGRACAPQRDWASIATDYVKAFGLVRRDEAEDAPPLEAKSGATTEQVFFNDVLGLPFEQASSAPPWETIRNRVEYGPDEDRFQLGRIPAGAAMLTAGVDCQDDRIEIHVKAFGRQLRSWTIDYRVIPHHVSTEEGRAGLDAVLKSEWRTALGRAFPLGMLAIDGGAYTDDVWSWAKKHPWARVIIVKGARSQTGPAYQPMKFERRQDGAAKRRQKRAFMVNVSMLKAEFYQALRVEDPLARHFCGFATGLGDEFYRQITAERRKTVRLPSGVTETRWDLVEPTRRNEALDGEIYARVAALRSGWRANTDGQWDALEALWSAPTAEAQADLFVGAADAPAGPAPRIAPARKKSISELLP